MNLRQREKAAIIVRLILSHGTRLRLADLPADLQKQLARDVSSIRQIDQDTLTAVVEEFLEAMGAAGLTFGGGIQEALTILDGSISATAAVEIAREEGIELTADPWPRILEIDEEHLIPLAEKEAVEVAAVMLSKLPVEKSAKILGQIEGERARRIAYAVSLTSNIGPDAVRRIGRAILAQLDDIPRPAFEESPVDRVGAILNSSPSNTRESVLEGLEEENADFADKVRKAIFTFANISERIMPRDVPKITRVVDPDTLVKAMWASRDRGEDSWEFLLGNMSKRLAEDMRDQVENMQPIKKKEQEAAMDAVVGEIRELVKVGELNFVVADDDEDEE